MNIFIKIQQQKQLKDHNDKHDLGKIIEIKMKPIIENYFCDYNLTHSKDIYERWDYAGTEFLYEIKSFSCSYVDNPFIYFNESKVKRWKPCEPFMIIFCFTNRNNNDENGYDYYWLKWDFEKMMTYKLKDCYNACRDEFETNRLIDATDLTKMDINDKYKKEKEQNI